MKIKEIVWDWNGTLVDDAFLCVEILNDILVNFDQSPISIEYYRNNFSFPVSDFYQRISLPYDGNEFEEISLSFISSYRKQWKRCKLQPSARQVLKMVHGRGLDQTILSAAKQSDVEIYTDHFELTSFFSKVIGTDNIKAEGKIDLGKNFLLDSNLQPEEILLIGDTFHDLEVANEIGCSALLYSRGHNSKIQLSRCKCEKIDHLKEVVQYLHR